MYQSTASTHVRVVQDTIRQNEMRGQDARLCEQTVAFVSCPEREPFILTVVNKMLRAYILVLFQTWFDYCRFIIKAVLSQSTSIIPKHFAPSFQSRLEHGEGGQLILAKAGYLHFSAMCSEF